jgi:hypothetical protein
MSVPEPPYWFPAKRYGWGWGPPATWQGWTVSLAWFALLIGGVIRLAPHHRGYLPGFVGVMTLLLFAVCYAKGEPPRWRWGGRDL